MANATGARHHVFTWHVHGTYLYYLCHANADFFVPVKPGRPEGYGGRAGALPWPANLHEVPAERVSELDFDCVLFQSENNYRIDQYEVLNEQQRRLPRIYLEHDPPRMHPTDTRHPAAGDAATLLVHVTHFNRLMWDADMTPTRVIEHGVTVPDAVPYTGELARGIAVVNNIASRGRRLGADLFLQASASVPLDSAGMGTWELGGLGELSRAQLFAAEAERRFFFNPIRYTSLGLSVCEAMMLGMPVVGLSTTEMARVVENGVSGYLDTDIERVIDCMGWLLAEPGEARRWGAAAREAALTRFSIERFARDWEDAFTQVAGRPGDSHVALSSFSGGTR